MRSIVITQYRSTVDMLAGATEPRTDNLLFVVEEVRLDDGSLLIMMRDPWGLALQLCRRAKPLLS